jgi:hypothetical protein
MANGEWRMADGRWRMMNVNRVERRAQPAVETQPTLTTDHFTPRHPFIRSLSVVHPLPAA